MAMITILLVALVVIVLLAIVRACLSAVMETHRPFWDTKP